MARKGGSWSIQKDGSLKENKPGEETVKAAPTVKKETKKDKAKLESDKE